VDGSCECGNDPSSSINEWLTTGGLSSSAQLDVISQVSKKNIDVTRLG
jgi:hypothetical protein